MLICRVVGTVVSTIKQEGLHAGKLLLVKPTDGAGLEIGGVFVAIDTVGAGEDELVIVAVGSSARQTSSTRDVPVDATIIGIIDSVSHKSKKIFDKASH